MKYRFGPGLGAAMRARGLTARQVSAQAHVSPATVASALHGRDVQMATALRIAQAVTEAPVVPELRDWGQLDGL